ncbi:RHS repeat-associated core domain-containing protein [Pseudomonas sp. 5RIF]|uniref:RHS repeat-associated core domain-containing protein n=1 Tax=Pseudomonas sp. 5RIF TaxID=3093714 RepID=UPI0030E96FD2
MTVSVFLTVLWSVEELKMLATDSRGTILLVWGAMEEVENRTYSPYGFVLKNDTGEILLAYMGEMLDVFVGCYLLGSGYRAYRPSLMRFISPDGLSPFAEGGINCYAGLANDPINNIDPSGRSILNYIKAKVPFGLAPHTRARYKTIQKFGLSEVSPLQSTENRNGRLDKSALFKHNPEAVKSRMHQDFRRIDTVGDAQALVGTRHKFIFTSRGELLTGNVGGGYFAHPDLRVMSKGRDNNVVAAGMIAFRDGKILLSGNTGHYRASQSERPNSFDPVIYYLGKLGVDAELIRGNPSFFP